ncbi:hypothetical protein KKI24_20295 [bacterium]|nr:hypothetical protein [bacterium]
MSRQNLIRILVISILLMTMTSSLLAQQEDVYVDAPIGPGQPNAGQPNAGQVNAAPAGPAGTYRDQFNWGLINYGFTEHVYYQFSGDGIFSGGNSPSSFLNIGWIRIIPLDFKYLPGMAFGADFMNLSQTSEDVYSGDSDVVTGPAIDMSLYVTDVKIRLFFMDPIAETLHPFFGISWGLVFGDFKTTKVGGQKYSTDFFGFLVSRNIGVQIKIGERGGLVTEFRTVTANSVRTSNDPFGRGSDGSVNLDFSGITIALTGYYRF